MWNMEGLEVLFFIDRVSKEIYTSARVLRVFTLERREVSPENVLGRITQPSGNISA